MDFYVQVYHHVLGTSPDADTYVIGKDFPRIAEIELETQPKTGHLLVTVQKGDGGEFELHLRKPGGPFKQLAKRLAACNAVTTASNSAWPYSTMKAPFASYHPVELI